MVLEKYRILDRLLLGYQNMYDSGRISAFGRQRRVLATAVRHCCLGEVGVNLRLCETLASCVARPYGFVLFFPHAPSHSDVVNVLLRMLVSLSRG